VFRCLAEDAHKSKPGFRDRWIYSWCTTFDAIIFGYYEGEQLMYAARTRNGFTPAIRPTLMRKFQGLETGECPFANLPELKVGRWSEGLTAEKMKECRWLKPVLVGEFEFLEWTPDEHLRHSRFVAFREGEKVSRVGRGN
jgi:bifunctional non-homologous end joining protein LigD